jgi:hypothetical protein
MFPGRDCDPMIAAYGDTLEIYAYKDFESTIIDLQSNDFDFKNTTISQG